MSKAYSMPAPGYVRNPLISKIGRNEKCVCLSGLKFKKCCLPKLSTVVTSEEGDLILKEILVLRGSET